MHFSENIAQVIAYEAFDFYLGNKSSAEAFARIDRAIVSVWNYYDGTLNDSRELFDALVDAMLDFDMDRKAIPSYDLPEYGSAIVSVEEYDALIASL